MGMLLLSVKTLHSAKRAWTSETSDRQWESTRKQLFPFHSIRRPIYPLHSTDDSQWPRYMSRNVFAHSNTAIVCSNPTQGMDVYVCFCSVFMLSCVDSGLATC
jgi:hypothetical protein